MKITSRGAHYGLAIILATCITACGDTSGRQRAANATVESCMQCHNGSKRDDYAGPGMENPHPVPGAATLTCTQCHGGNPDGDDKAGSHVPAPPQIGGREQWKTDRFAYFNRLTMTGLDKLPDYVVDNKSYVALDYLQFINPGDLRVVNKGRSCGVCHQPHVDMVSGSPLATEAGMLSGGLHAVGIDNAVPANAGLYQKTAADRGFRGVADADFDASDFGTVDQLLEFPVFSVRNQTTPDAIHNNPAYDVENLALGLGPDNRALAGSALANLVHEQIAFTCGDCHLGSAGANNRTGDYRSSGCSACHMPYSVNGRSTSGDPNVPRDEPYDPDDIDEPELPHVRRHLIVSHAKTLPSGEQVNGIDDYACAGCHQGSNRTVMQYWGIRLDQNQDVRRGVQYPANPVSWKNTAQDARLFGFEGRPDRGNNREFNGRNANQYLLMEDYDGDGRDDTPADVHYEAGMGCIDCHGSVDLHGGDVNAPRGKRISSRMEHSVTIQCESCHGRVDAYAETKRGTAFNGETADLGVDSRGSPILHVVRESDGQYYMYSRLTGKKHFISQTRDTVIDSGKSNPFTGKAIYSAKASYAMGRDDGNPTTGIGPQQPGEPSGIAHSDSMDCAACHSSWTNTCMGCHLEGEYNTGNNFSNITGKRIVFRERFAEFVYQSPVFFQLGVDPSNRVAQTSSNTKMFFRWKDRRNDRSEVFAFSGRSGDGNNPAQAFPSLGHNAMMAHSIRGRVSATNEGPRYCVACHNTKQGIEQYGDLYSTFRAAMAGGQFDKLDFPELQNHFGRNPGNRLNSPLFVHMVAGLGSGLFLFDKEGGAVNPLDPNANRYGSNGVAPKEQFDLSRVRFNLDRVVGADGVATGSSNHALIAPIIGPNLRDGAANTNMAGPLGARIIRLLTDPDLGLVLQGWLDADGAPQGEVPEDVK